MRVLITGGFGCIGSWITRHLLHRGDVPVIFDLREDFRRVGLVLDESELPRVQFVVADVTDVGAVRQAIDRHEITHVIHLAGLQVAVCRADPLLGARVNVLGTLAVFEAVRQAGRQIEGFVYASSAAVFGPPEAYGGADSPLANDALLAPATQYGAFKVCNEHGARVYFEDHRVSSVGLRPWAVYGVGRDFGVTSEPTKAIKSVALGRDYPMSFGGTLDFQWVEDVARTFVRCLSAKPGAAAYNLRGTVTTVAQFHRDLCAIAPEAERLISIGERQLGIAPNLDDAELQRDFGPLPVLPLRDGIQRTLEHFRSLAADGRLDAADLDADAAARAGR